MVPGLDVTEQEYMDAMTLSGTKVEGYRKLAGLCPLPTRSALRLQSGSLPPDRYLPGRQSACRRRDGKGSGWIEILGCGMVPPKVLKMSGPKEFPDKFLQRAF